MNKTVVVTGGNGYIGSHVCKKLFTMGFDVQIIDNFSTSPSQPVHSYGTFHQHDIADIEVRDLLVQLEPVCLFHFASRASVEESQKEPILYYVENVSKTIKLLEYCVQTGLKKIIFSSTCATYGKVVGSINELVPQNPINTYGSTKLMVEQIIKDFCEKRLLDAVIFRCFNAIGASEDGELGENHEPETHIIPNICKSVLKKTGNIFKIYGSNCDTPDGTCVRDYIDVIDLSLANYLGLNFIMNHTGFYDFNLGSGMGISVLDLIQNIESVLDAKVKYQLESSRRGDPPSLIADSKKAHEQLGFTPKVSLSKSIKNVYNYLKNN